MIAERSLGRYTGGGDSIRALSTDRFAGSRRAWARSGAPTTRSTDRVVALKLLPLQWAEDEVYLQRFRREAHAAARLNQPQVCVPIHNYGDVDGRLYVDMRLIDGSDLQALLNPPVHSIPARAVVIIEQVAMALDAAHQAGLVHRDVKPSNILIARYDFAHLIDFGVARASL